MLSVGDWTDATGCVVPMDAVIALPLAFASLALTKGNIKGPGEESDPEFAAISSHDAQHIDKINNKITVFHISSLIKDITHPSY